MEFWTFNFTIPWYVALGALIFGLAIGWLVGPAVKREIDTFRKTDKSP